MSNTRITFQDERVTEFEDGTEEVRFSQDEERRMAQDPVYFGYSCRNGHPIREDDPFVIAEGCPTCFNLAECGSEEDLDHALATWGAPRFPVIRCGHCKGRHVGIGGVRRCSEVAS